MRLRNQTAAGLHEIDSVIRSVLREYPKWEAQISLLEKQAKGIGVDFSVRVTSSYSSYRKKSQAEILHGLTVRERNLAAVGQAYAADGNGYFHGEKAARLFDRLQKEQNNPDAALEEIQEILIGTNRWEEHIALTETERAAQEIIGKRERAERKLNELKEKKSAVEDALMALGSYEPLLEKLLRLKYIEGKSVPAVCAELDPQVALSETEYRRKRKKAVWELAGLLGIV
jgi:hypothetical protein